MKKIPEIRTFAYWYGVALLLLKYVVFKFPVYSHVKLLFPTFKRYESALHWYACKLISAILDQKIFQDDIYFHVKLWSLEIPSYTQAKTIESAVSKDACPIMVTNRAWPCWSWENGSYKVSHIFPCKYLIPDCGPTQPLGAMIWRN